MSRDRWVELEASGGRERTALLRYVKRGVEAALFIAMDYALFFLIPRTFFESVSRLSPEIDAMTVSYFLSIATLTAMQNLLKDHMLGNPSGVALGIVEATYMFTITQGGTLEVSVNGLSVILEFKALLYLMMIHPMLGIAKNAFEMIHKSSSQPVELVELVGK